LDVLTTKLSSEFIERIPQFGLVT